MAKETKVSLEDLSEDQRASLTMQAYQDEIGEKTEASSLAEYVELQVEKRADEKIATQLALHEKSNSIANFVKSVTEGTEEEPIALGVHADKLTELLEGMDDTMRELAYEIFKAILDKGIVDFSEAGTNETTTGKVELPKEVQTALDDGTLKVESLSQKTLGLGDLEQYNLAKWQGSKEKK